MFCHFKLLKVLLRVSKIGSVNLTVGAKPQKNEAKRHVGGVK